VAQKWSFCSEQGDQIGRTFAYWEIAFFDQFMENFLKYRKFLGYFLPHNKFCNKVDKKWLGYIWGDFFVNSSGYPGPEVNLQLVMISFN
jgi:hypothetical protein